METVHQYQETLTALALVAAGEGVAIVPTLALSGVSHDGVDVLDVPGLGTRRIVLRRFDRRRAASTPVDTVARLLRESAAAFDTRSTS
jgi:DNA-binding transcriptional LysR family regulator